LNSKIDLKEKNLQRWQHIAEKWRFKNGKWKRYYSEPNDQTKRVLQSKVIRGILDNDKSETNPNGLTPEEQKDAIRVLPWVTIGELEQTIPTTGPILADSIRVIISKHRATNRSDKDINRER
jgi:hypothetical protein